MVRWLRWAPLFLLAIAGAVVAAMVLTRGDDSTIAPWSEGEGPGSPSLDMPSLTNAAATPIVAAVRPASTWFEVRGPGSPSMDLVSAPPVPTVTAADVATWFESEGPGSPSMEMSSTPPVADPATPWETDGPGSHSLDMTG